MDILLAANFWAIVSFTLQSLDKAKENIVEEVKINQLIMCLRNIWMVPKGNAMEFFC